MKLLPDSKGLVRPCAFAAAAALSLLLAACGGGGGGGDSGSSAAPEATLPKAAEIRALSLDATDATNWEIGPIVGGQSYSTGMPLHPAASAGGWVIDLPGAGGSVNYVTMQTGSLAGKTRVTMRYRVETDAGVQIVPRNYPTRPSLLTLYFQRGGDNWSAQGEYEAYRWYASYSRHSPIKAGEYTIEARFDQNWTAILSSTAVNNPAGFQLALANADRIGFVLGGGDGAGHGVHATGRARLVITSFQVE